MSIIFLLVATILTPPARAELPPQAKPQWVILSAIAERYTQAEHRAGIDPVVVQNSANLRILLSLRYDGPAAEVLAPKLRVVDIAQKSDLTVPGNFSVGMDDVGSMAWLMSPITGSPTSATLETGRVFGRAAPLTYYVVDVSPSVRNVRVFLGDALPKDVEITRAVKKKPFVIAQIPMPSANALTCRVLSSVRAEKVGGAAVSSGFDSLRNKNDILDQDITWILHATSSFKIPLDDPGFDGKAGTEQMRMLFVVPNQADNGTLLYKNHACGERVSIPGRPK